MHPCWIEVIIIYETDEKSDREPLDGTLQNKNKSLDSDTSFYCIFIKKK